MGSNTSHQTYEQRCIEEFASKVPIGSMPALAFSVVAKGAGAIATRENPAS